MSQVIKLLKPDELERAENLIGAIDYLRLEALRLDCCEAVSHLEETKKSIVEYLNSSQIRHPSVGG